ncbi:unnamed protein product, partial [Urochloa humidicola]
PQSAAASICPAPPSGEIALPPACASNHRWEEKRRRGERRRRRRRGPLRGGGAPAAYADAMKTRSADAVLCLDPDATGATTSARHARRRQDEAEGENERDPNANDLPVVAPRALGDLDSGLPVLYRVDTATTRHSSNLNSSPSPRIPRGPRLLRRRRLR